MNCCYEPSWSRKMLLLLALVSGTVATQLVPPYQELAFIPKDEAISTPALSASKSRGMTSDEIESHHLTRVRTSG
jgi:hypothetical protein